MNTPEFRASYPSVFTAQKNDLNGKMEYSIVAVFPLSADLTELKAAAQKVVVDKYGPDKAKWPTGMRSPFRQCKERWKNEGGVVKIPAGYEEGEAVFLTLKSANKPGVVDQNVADIIEPHQFYAGCYARASVNPYVYDQKGNRGVSFGLNNVQKLRDGDPLGGRSAPSSDFQAVAAPAGASTGAASLFD